MTSENPSPRLDPDGLLLERLLEEKRVSFDTCERLLAEQAARGGRRRVALSEILFERGLITQKELIEAATTRESRPRNPAFDEPEAPAAPKVISTVVAADPSVTAPSKVTAVIPVAPAPVEPGFVGDLLLERGLVSGVQLADALAEFEDRFGPGRASSPSSDDEDEAPCLITAELEFADAAVISLEDIEAELGLVERDFGQSGILGPLGIEADSRVGSRAGGSRSADAALEGMLRRSGVLGPAADGGFGGAPAPPTRRGGSAPPLDLAPKAFVADLMSRSTADGGGVGDLLVERGVISPEDLEAALSEIDERFRASRGKEDSGVSPPAEDSDLLSSLEAELGDAEQALVSSVEMELGDIVPPPRAVDSVDAELARELEDEVVLSTESVATLARQVVPESRVRSRSGDASGTRSNDGRKLVRFVLEDRIGRGHSGVVYRAHDTVTNRSVAIKFMRDPELAEEQSVRETTRVRPVRHSGTTPIHTAGTTGGRLFVARDFIDGDDVERLARHGALGARGFAPIFRDVAWILDTCHERGVPHLNLKPQNIIVDHRGKPHLTDFGIPDRLAHDLPGAGVPWDDGVATYIAPEQADPTRGPIGRPADVFAFGATLYHAVTGSPPYLDGNVTEAVRQVLFEKLDRPRARSRSVPEDVEAIILRCMDPDPEGRPEIRAVAEALDRVARGEAQRAFAFVPRRTFNGTIVLLVAVASVVLVVGGLNLHWKAEARAHRVRLAERRLIEPSRPASSEPWRGPPAPLAPSLIEIDVIEDGPRRYHHTRWEALRVGGRDPALVERLVTRVRHDELWRALIASGGGGAGSVRWELHIDAEPIGGESVRVRIGLVRRATDATVFLGESVAPIGPSATGAADEASAALLRDAFLAALRDAGSSVTTALVPTLVRALSGEDPGRRSLAAASLALARPDDEATIRSLLRVALGDPLPRVRRAAADALRAALDDDERFVALLLEDRNAPLPARRRAMMTALASFRPDARAVLPSLIAGLRDSDPAVRATAADVIRRVGDEALDAAPALRGCLVDDAAPTVRAAAASALGALGAAADTEVHTGLVTALADSSDDVRSAAADALVELGPATVPALRSALTPPSDDPPSTATRGACEVLGRLGPAAVEATPDLLATAESSVRARRIDRALSALVALLRVAGDAAPGLLAPFGADRETVSAATAGIAELPEDRGALEAAVGPILREMLAAPLADDGAEGSEGAPRSADEIVSAILDAEASAARARGAVIEIRRLRADARAEVAARLLAEAPENASGPLREVIDEALCVIGPISPAAIRALTELLGRPDEALRRRALRSLGRLDPEGVSLAGNALRAAIPALVELLSEGDDETAEAAIELFGRLGPAGVDGLRRLIPWLREEDDLLRRRSARAIGALGAAAAEAAPAVVAASDRDLDGLVFYVDALGRMGPAARRGLRPVLGALEDPRPTVRRAAVDAIARIALDQPGVPGRLADRLADPDPAVRAAAGRAITAAGPAAAPALARATTSPSESARGFAARTLRAMPEADRARAVEGLTLALEELAGRGLAADLLGELGPAAAPAARGLARTLAEGAGNGDEDALPVRCAIALLRIGEPARSALDEVLEGDAATRAALAAAVRAIGSDEGISVEILQRIVDGRDAGARVAAVSALRERGVEIDPIDLERVANGVSPGRGAEADVLLALTILGGGPSPETHRPLFASMMNDPRHAVRERAYALVVAHASRDLLPRLLRDLEKAEPAIGETICAAIGALADPVESEEALSAVRRVARSADFFLATAAAAALEAASDE